jgi:hypothetical protein
MIFSLLALVFSSYSPLSALFLPNLHLFYPFNFNFPLISFLFSFPFTFSHFLFFLPSDIGFYYPPGTYFPIYRYRKYFPCRIQGTKCLASTAYLVLLLKTIYVSSVSGMRMRVVSGRAGRDCRRQTCSCPLLPPPLVATM